MPLKLTFAFNPELTLVASRDPSKVGLDRDITIVKIGERALQEKGGSLNEGSLSARYFRVGAPNRWRS